jgi:hypothetical protein
MRGGSEFLDFGDAYVVDVGFGVVHHGVGASGLEKWVILALSRTWRFFQSSCPHM